MTLTVRASINVERPGASESYIRAASSFVAGGILGLLLGWLADPGTLDDAALAETIIDLLPPWMSGSESSDPDPMQAT